jgi:hypothetical protein
MALALVFLIMATSVLKRKLFSSWPKTLMPEHCPMISGTATIFVRSLLPKVGMGFIIFQRKTFLKDNAILSWGGFLRNGIPQPPEKSDAKVIR